jgi:hypothetical protein
MDALDECEQKDGVKLNLKLFSGSQQLDSPKLRIFCTSRPELPVRLGFRAIRGTHPDLILHGTSKPVIEHCLKVFFFGTNLRKYDVVIMKMYQKISSYHPPGSLRQISGN